jgi:hypothetical protein
MQPLPAPPGTLLANSPGMTGTRHGTSKSRAAALLLALLPAAGSLPAADMARFQAAADIRAAAEAVVRERLADAPGQVTAQAEELDPRLQMPACDAPLVAALPARTQLSSRLTAEVPLQRGAPVAVVRARESHAAAVRGRGGLAPRARQSFGAR